ncbi:abasic site processing protein HMCES [Anabrus simplex]|uniref:abasic site processing protein HMCES n=1 Tax=Anabrus simplex TaxID=316456 RepID=UPI0035A2D982
MCGRAACTLCPDDIQKACSYRDKPRGKFKKPEWKEREGTTHLYKPSYNLAPTDVIPVLLSGSQFESESGRVLQPMIWGLIPPWHKGDPKTHGLTTHNCRLEGITSSKLYASIFKRGHRCVVVCDGFFEWQTTKGKANKQPYFIYMPQPNGIKIEEPDTWSDEWDEEVGWKGPQLIKMAGLYDKWKSPDGEDLFSCTILTTDSNETLSWLHHRMPVILETDEQVANWLDAESVPANKALSLLTPVKMLAWHPVSTIVNNSRNKVPECIKPVDLKKPEVKKSASGSFMDAWIKKANTPVKRESHSKSPEAKHVKTEPKDSPVLKEVETV